MDRKIPQVVTESNVFLDGYGYLGVTKKVTLPKIEQEMIEVKGAVQSMHSTGSIKPLELSLTISNVDQNQLSSIGINTFTNKVPILLKSSVFSNGEAVPLLAAFTGDFELFEIKDLEGGSEVEVEIKMQVHFYELTIGALPMVLVDTNNMICMIGGLDYLAQLRTNLV